ncbi:MAG: ElyC/SanA/YdcF family protein [Bacteroidales bacterium]|nr:ElyC/SanA/YdcF family protein [Bacteroidales bacterium]
MKATKKGSRSIFFSRVVIALEVMILLPVVLLISANLIIGAGTKDYLFDEITEVPHNKVGLVLGTSPRVRNGGPNPYFTNRMQAAAELFHNGNVNYLIVSGDNRSRYYNEPQHMRNALIDLEVPDSAIFTDNAGLRTLDSVLRARDVFGQQNITVVSQRFHNQRAIYLARRKGMTAYAYNAPDVPANLDDRTRTREWFAKLIVFWDLLINKQASEQGERIVIGDQ